MAAAPHHPGGGHGLRRAVRATRAGRRPVAQRGLHPAVVPRVIGVVMDLVADHVQLGPHAALGQQPGQLRHLVGVPARRELAGVNEAEYPLGLPRRAGPCAGELRRRRDDRREQHALAARRGHAAFQEAAELLGLAQHVLGRLRHIRQPADGLGGHRRDRLRDVGQIGPQPAAEVVVLHHLVDQPAAAQHHDVVPVLRVHRGQHLRRLRGAEPVGPDRLQQPLFRWPPDRDARLTLQRGEQPVGLHRRLHHQRYRAPGPGQGQDHRLHPDRGPVDQVQVDVAVHQGRT